MSKRKPWRRYPPLLTLAGALVLAIFTLPSALNLPLANPGQTLEYAPVPGDGNQQGGGNFAGLGLGTSGAAPSSGGILQDLLGETAQGSAPTNKQCVGTPPRQTEDPLSPPCVAYFKGDNGGSTYQGVTKDEIRIVVYMTCCGPTSPTSQGTETEPQNHWDDLWQPAQPGEFVNTRNMRVWQAYFNARYQAYGRRAHFYVFYGSCNNVNGSQIPPQCTPEAVRADAAAAFARVRPFAEMDYGDWAGAFRDFMAGKGVLTFGGSDLRPTSFYTTYPGLVWSFQSPVEYQASSFASYVCSKVAPYTVSFSGNALDARKPRYYGLIYAADPAHTTGIDAVGPAFKKDVASCGVQFVDTATVSVIDSSCCTTPPDYAASKMATFKKDGVTTILWPGGAETGFSNAAAAIDYIPEWVTWGDGFLDQYAFTSWQNQGEWANHAVVVTTQTRVGKDGLEPECEVALRSAAPQEPFPDEGFACGGKGVPLYYDDLRQLFTGIQVAGPHLDPQHIDQGFHAIPAHPSTSTYEPACFYNPGDYTCVKDAVVEWWNPSGNPGNTQNSPWKGCWMMMEDGLRHLPGQWPAGDVMAQMRSSDVCNPF